MRLLLDEQISPDIAEALRRLGHDVRAVAERRELMGRPDLFVLVAGSSEGRAVVSENVGDFTMLGSRRLPGHRWHQGVVLVSRRTFPGTRDGFGRLIRALDALLRAHPGADDLVGQVVWLRSSPDDAG